MAAAQKILHVGASLLALLWVAACADEVGAVDDTGTSAPPASSTGQGDTTGSGAGPGGSMESTGAPTTGGPAATEDSTDTGAPPGEPALVVVGYGGMRARSFDDGVTWQDYVQEADAGGDDANALRGVTWGAGRFVAVGWRIFSSPDGAAWAEHEHPHPVWYGAVAFGNEVFIAVGGDGLCARSSDGQAWASCADANGADDPAHVRSVLFHEGRFWAADGSGVLRSTTDGEAWQVEDAGFGSPWVAVVGGQITALPAEAPADLPGARLRGAWDTGIQRAEPSTEAFTTVYAIPNGNNVFDANRFAFTAGFAAP